MRAPKESSTPRLGSARLGSAAEERTVEPRAHLRRRRALGCAVICPPDSSVRVGSRREFSKVDTIVDSLDRIDRFLTKWVVQR
jgi:hypothetical protein